MLFLLLGFCVLSGKWHLLLYAAGAVAMFLVVLLYGLYLEYNVQEELERRRKAEALNLARFSKRI